MTAEEIEALKAENEALKAVTVAQSREIEKAKMQIENDPNHVVFDYKSENYQFCVPKIQWQNAVIETAEIAKNPNKFKDLLDVVVHDHSTIIKKISK